MLEQGSTSQAQDPNKELPGVGAGGTSGHSNIRRFRFAFAAYGPYASALVIFFAKDMYVLKLGGHTERVGALATAWSAIFPLFYPLAGHLMDREPPLLAIKGWGRRAPWYLCHLAPLAVTVAIIYLPGLAWTPPAGSWYLEVWLGVFLFIAGWCLAVLLDTYESARAEIYPFFEERALVEAMAKLVGSCAAATGILAQFVLWMVFTLRARVLVSVLLGIFVLMSLEAVPVLQDARQPRNTVVKHSIRLGIQVLMKAPMFHATALRFWYAAADTVCMNFGVYYVTFVDGLTSIERTQWMFICGLLVGLLEFFVLTPIWGLAWSGEGNGRLADFIRWLVPPMHRTCFIFHVLGAFLPAMIIGILPIAFPGAEPWEWVLATVAQRICFSPQTFFRMNAFCWSVDEDCHNSNGVRREAIHAGAMKLFEDEGRTLAFVLFIGLGRAGLQTRNCELDCDGMPDRSGCVKACDLADITRQPDTVSIYIKVVLIYVVPLFNLLCALHIYLYPIRGERLTKLQETQAVVFKNIQDTTPGGTKNSCQPSAPSQSVVEPGDEDVVAM